MQHKWTDQDGIKHNFCIKCGIKKTRARRRHCNVSTENWKKNLNHKLIDEYKDFHGKMHCKCSNCGIEVNKRWSIYSLITIDDTEKIYTAYVEKKNDKGEVIKRSYTTNTPYQRNKLQNKGIEIKFWLIGCAYTEDEVEVMDIIL
jgi:hypothetical protein